MSAREPIKALARLLRKAGLAPYFCREDCASWRGKPCDKECGPHKLARRPEPKR